MTDEWLTTREAARLLKIHMITLTKWAASGYVPATKVGRCWRYSRAELEAWIRDPVKRLALVPDAAPSPSAAKNLPATAGLRSRTRVTS